MDRETGPFGLKKQFSYQEVLRNIQQQPYDIPVPARVGLRTWDDPFYQNMIQSQAAYLGDVAKSGFSHEAPYQPPPRDEVFYDANSDAGDLPPAYPRGGPPPPPPGNLGVFSALYDQPPDTDPHAGGVSYYPPPPPPGNLGVFSALYGQRPGTDPHAGGVSYYPPPPPPGNLGVFSALYGQRPGNMPIQSGLASWRPSPRGRRCSCPGSRSPRAAS